MSHEAMSRELIKSGYVFYATMTVPYRQLHHPAGS